MLKKFELLVWWDPEKVQKETVELIAHHFVEFRHIKVASGTADYGEHESEHCFNLGPLGLENLLVLMRKFLKLDSVSVVIEEWTDKEEALARHR